MKERSTPEYLPLLRELDFCKAGNFTAISHFCSCLSPKIWDLAGHVYLEQVNMSHVPQAPEEPLFRAGVKCRNYNSGFVVSSCLKGQ